MSLSKIALCCVCLLSVTAMGQQLPLQLQPAAPAPGQTIAFTVTAPHEGTYYREGALIELITRDRPDGPIVYQASPKELIIRLLPEGEQLTETWNQNDLSGQQVGTGTYWVHILHSRTAEQFSRSMHEITIQHPAPVLDRLTQAHPGQTAVMSLSSSADSLGPYLVAASLSAGDGFTAQGIQFDLDLDVLFSLSFPVPHPGLFTNFQATLDGEGQAPPILVHLPNDPALYGQAFHLQALVTDAKGTRSRASNLLRVPIGG